MELTHGMANVEPGLRLHYVKAGDGRACSCCYTAFRSRGGNGAGDPGLVNAGLRVVAPDYRGAGEWSRPPGGYDKLTMAGDIHRYCAATSSSRARSCWLGTTSG